MKDFASIVLLMLVIMALFLCGAFVNLWLIHKIYLLIGAKVVAVIVLSALMVVFSLIGGKSE